MSAPDLITTYYVFIARFQDGRMKDRIAFQQADNRVQAERDLAETWYSHDDPGVSVDSLGPFHEFFSAAPKLNYDFKANQDLPEDLSKEIGEDTLQQIVDVAGSDAGWEEMPPQSVITPDVATESKIVEKYGSNPAVDDPNRSALTDRLTQFRHRIRRFVENDYQDYENLNRAEIAKHGFDMEDHRIADLLLTMTQNRVQHPRRPPQYLVVGVLLDEDGLPETYDMWTEERSPGEDMWYPSLSEYPEYDAVLTALTKDSRRKVQHRVLDAATRQIIESKEEQHHHDWFTVSLDRIGNRGDWMVTFARTPEHAAEKVKRHLGVSADLVDATTRYTDIRHTVTQFTREASSIVFVESHASETPPKLEEVFNTVTDGKTELVVV